MTVSFMYFRIHINMCFIIYIHTSCHRTNEQFLWSHPPDSAAAQNQNEVLKSNTVGVPQKELKQHLQYLQSISIYKVSISIVSAGLKHPRLAWAFHLRPRRKKVPKRGHLHVCHEGFVTRTAVGDSWKHRRAFGCIGYTITIALTCTDLHRSYMCMCVYIQWHLLED